MNKILTLFCGITFGSVILTSIGQKDTNKINATIASKGSLALVANGEDFVREGFVSKDGWQINFEHLYVNISDAIAYSTESSFEPQKGDTKNSINYQDKVNLLTSSQATDLAVGDTQAEPILVNQVDVSEGFYNALSWKLATADADSPIPGKTIVLIGTATKQEQTIDFNLGFDRPTEYICGEFIGDERQGIVTADNPGTLEATFHFDHIFGDQDTPPEEAINQDALGFEPLAQLASNGAVNLEDQDFATKLSVSDYQKLTKAIAGLGHVGEGHCVVNDQ